MANPYRDDLLAQALKGSRGATRKISRLKNKVDVYVAGTEFDPRKSPKQLRRYTTKQLEAYNNRVAQFNDRSTQFVPDAHHRPIPAAEFKPLQVAQLERRRHASDQLERKRNILLPGVVDRNGKMQPGTETIGERRDKMRSDRKMAGNPSVNDPYDPKVNKSTDLEGRASIKELTKQAKKQSTKGWDDKELKRQIGEFEQILKRIQDAELAAKVKQMTPGQFKALWNDTGFANDVSQEYEVFRSKVIDEDDKSWYGQLIRDSFQDAHRKADWALQQDL